MEYDFYKCCNKFYVVSFIFILIFILILILLHY